MFLYKIILIKNVYSLIFPVIQKEIQININILLFFDTDWSLKQVYFEKLKLYNLLSFLISKASLSSNIKACIKLVSIYIVKFNLG